MLNQHQLQLATSSTRTCITSYRNRTFGTLLNLLLWLQTNWLEIVGVVTGFVCVLLSTRQNIWCWPIGIVSCIAYFVFFNGIKLYVDQWLQVFFVGTSIYGWWWWKNGGLNQSEAPVSTLTNAQRVLLGAATIASVLLIGFLVDNFTDSLHPYADAIASGASVPAQLLMMRKKIECWPMWIGINILYLRVYFLIGAYPTMILYALFLVLAAMGFVSWRKHIKAPPNRETLRDPLPRIPV